jgi:glycerol-3-phosphate dehydrogenase
MSTSRRWVWRVAGVGIVGVGGVVVALTSVPTINNKRPAVPTTPLFNSAVQAVSVANAAALDAPPKYSRSTGLERLRRSENAKGSVAHDDLFDILVIGGGATGSAVAVDAASRGMRVGLVERGDFASETSSKSTKLIHGGVRYLEKAVFGLDVKQLALVYEALQERAALLRQAPHICNKLPTVVPCYSYPEAIFYWAGMKTYDLLAALGGSTIVGSRFADVEETLDLAPLVKQVRGPGDGKKLVGSVVYYDGTMDDARLNLSAALTASAMGVATVNYCEATAIVPHLPAGGPDASKGAVRPRSTVTVRDVITGKTINVETRFVVVAAGPFVDQVKQKIQLPTLSEGGAAAVVPRPIAKSSVVKAAGAHITLPAFLSSPRNLSAEHAAILVPKTTDGRVLFIAPWGGATIAGTTDRPVDSPDTPTATDDDVDFIVTSLNDTLSVKVTRNDVTSMWCGIRPLAANDMEGSTQNVVREHKITTTPAGIVSIVGGKWTTYRRMGADVVDSIINGKIDAEFSKQYTNESCKSLSSILPFVGAPKWFKPIEAAEDGAKYWKASERYEHRVDEATKMHLWHAYGVRATLLLQGAEALEKAKAFDRLTAPTAGKPAGKAAVGPGGVGRTTPEGSFDKLLPHRPFLSAEVVHACRHEMCMTPADFLCRRTRLAFVHAQDALAAVDKVTAIMAKEHKWPADRAAAEAAKARETLRTFLPPVDPHTTEAAKKRTSIWEKITGGMSY